MVYMLAVFTVQLKNRISLVNTYPIYNHSGMSTQRTGLALGSGGARGWAHIGVIQALRELDIQVDIVTGTSMGSLVGAAIASNRVDSLHKIALELDWKHLFHYFFEFTFPRTGLIDGGKIVQFLQEHVSTERIEDLAIPYAAVAADVITGKRHVISEGDVIQAVRSSISVPGIFSPVKLGDSMLVDGGIVDPVPVDVAADMGAEFIIAVNLNQNIGDMSESPLLPGPKVKPVDKFEKKLTDFIHALNKVPLIKKKPFDIAPVKEWFSAARTPDILEVLGNSLRIMEAQLAQFQLEASPPDILIQPSLNHINFMDFHRADEAIQIGYQETMKVAREHQDALEERLSIGERLQQAIEGFFSRIKD